MDIKDITNIDNDILTELDAFTTNLKGGKEATVRQDSALLKKSSKRTSSKSKKSEESNIEGYTRLCLNLPTVIYKKLKLYSALENKKMACIVVDLLEKHLSKEGIEF